MFTLTNKFRAVVVWLMMACGRLKGYDSARLRCLTNKNIIIHNYRRDNSNTHNIRAV
jgi:hypothetical protein